MPEPKLCILCGAPRAPHAYKYCETCRKQKADEYNHRQRSRCRYRDAAGHLHRKDVAPAKAQKVKPTPTELEAAARARSSNGWIDADIVECRGCTYWRKLGCYAHACHYPIDTGRLRPCRPQDCYKHKGTPYRKGG